MFPTPVQNPDSFRPPDEFDEAAEFFTRFVRLQMMKATGFGHGLVEEQGGKKVSRLAGMKITMSDRTYEIQKNGEYRRVS